MALRITQNAGDIMSSFLTNTSIRLLTAAVTTFVLLLGLPSLTRADFIQIQTSTSAPQGLGATVIQGLSSQYLAGVAKNPLVSNTWSVKLFGVNPNYNAPEPPPSTLNQALQLGTTLYNYGFRDGQELERAQNLSDLSPYLGVAIDSTTFKTIYDSINQRNYADPPTPQLP